MKRRLQTRFGGQALVELALAAPLLLMLMATTFEFAWYFFQLYQLNSAVRVGTRVGAAQLGSTPPVFNFNAVELAMTGTLNGAVALSSRPTVVVSSCTWPTVEQWKYSPSAGSIPGDLTSPPQSGKLFTVYIKAKYWPFTRLIDFRTFGGPEHFQVSSTFVIK